ncbi:MAG: PspC domain-containing protein [Bernardetiaceae bacterium]|jgi:phage shock protein PspC (stress-responsive transcriptional regulator)|nr:PspC domain-containing protein [Bernardetiaceae bacterium]
MKNFKFYLEQNLFGVCTFLGERMGIAIGNIRLYFIYISFLTFGSPIIFYLVMAFWLNFKKYWRLQKSALGGR